MRISDWSSDVCSSDLPEIAANVPAAIPIDGNAYQAGTYRRNLSPNPPRQILHRCRPEVWYVIQKAMIQFTPSTFQGALKKASVNDHAGRRISRAQTCHHRAGGLAGNPGTGLHLYL